MVVASVLFKCLHVTFSSTIGSLFAILPSRHGHKHAMELQAICLKYETMPAQAALRTRVPGTGTDARTAHIEDFWGRPCLGSLPRAPCAWANET